MIAEVDLVPISIRGRFAFGMVCLERACAHFGIKSEKMDQLLDMLWSAVGRDDIGVWEAEFMSFFAQLRSGPVSIYVQLGWGHLAPRKLKEFDMFMDRALGIIADAHLYPSPPYDSLKADIPYVMAVASFMVENGIPLPDLAPFARSTSDVDYGWGHKVDPGFFREAPPGTGR